jgi:hypothetical protein
MHTHGVYESNDGGKSWQPTPDTGVSIRAAMSYQGRLLAASAYNGLLLQQGAVAQGAVASPETAHAGTASSTANSQ